MIEEIERVVRAMNMGWLNGRIDEMGKLFAEDVVFVAPDGSQLHGREQALESFRQFTAHAKTHHFEERDLQVSLFDGTAAAIVWFRIVYAYGGESYDEMGRDILVLSQASGGWQIVWRTQVTDSQDQDPM